MNYPHIPIGNLPPRRRRHSRPAFTVMETILSVGLLSMALVLVAQVGVECLRERVRTTDLQTAQEIAANILEDARGQSFKDLTDKWAKSQQLPDELTKQGWKLEVGVTPEKDHPLTRQVKVVVKWKFGTGPTPAPIELTALFTDRVTKKKGESK